LPAGGIFAGPYNIHTQKLRRITTMAFKAEKHDFIPFEKKVWLSSPTMHGDERKWVDKAIETNWVSTIGENVNHIER